MRVLVIVDVQYSMGHWFGWSYINKLNAFLKARASNYDAVMMLLEPKITADKSVLRQIKTAEHGEIDHILETLQPDAVPSFLIDYLTYTPIYKMYSKHLFNRMLELGILPNSQFITLPSRNVTGIYNMYLTSGLVALVDQLLEATHVDIIGGGVDKCVSLTHKLLTYHSIPSRILRPVCYEIRHVNTNRRKYNTFNTNPVRYANPSLISPEGLVPMTGIPFTSAYKEIIREFV